MEKLTQTIRKAYEYLVRIASSGQSLFLLAVRLYWGWQFFVTGKGKLANLGPVAEFFKSLGIPMPTLNAFLAGTAECFGGLLLLAGLASRLTAIPLIFTMIIAYLTADLDAVKSIFSEPDKFVSADPFLFLFASLIVLVFGPGLFSADALLGRLFRKAPIQNPNAETRT